MAKKGITREQLAETLGMSRSGIDRYCLGNREPSAATVERMATVLGVEPGWLLFGETIK